VPWPIEPMKAVTSDLPADEEHWSFEIKWDGMRALSLVADGAVQLRSSRGKDASGRFPEVDGLGPAFDGHVVILDGELVLVGDDGTPSFGRLQHRMHLASPTESRRRATEDPVTYMVFDLLHLDGNDVMPLPYTDRRRLLTELMPEGDRWRVPAHHEGEGKVLLEVASAEGLEGVMAKRLDSPYEPGRRSGAWRKVKVWKRQELVVGGWQPGAGNRTGQIGSLLVGYFDGGTLRYAGKVGTGFNTRELARLGSELQRLAADVCPFEPPPPMVVARVAKWVQPEIVVEVSFGEWTEDGVLRHPSYVGQRYDKLPAEVVREG
jgi:bifunctional non-homologous end joining protein LigD